TEYEPFYSFRHGVTRDTQQDFWHTSRHLSTHEGDRGTDVYLHLVDLGFNPKLPAESVLVVRTTCTNRDLPSQLSRAGEALYFELEMAAPIARLRCALADRAAPPSSAARRPMALGLAPCPESLIDHRSRR